MVTPLKAHVYNYGAFGSLTPKAEEQAVFARSCPCRTPVIEGLLGGPGNLELAPELYCNPLRPLIQMSELFLMVLVKENDKEFLGRLQVLGS